MREQYDRTYEKIKEYLKHQEFKRENNTIKIISRDKHWDSTLLTNQIYKLIESEGIEANIKAKKGTTFIENLVINVDINITIKVVATITAYVFFRRLLIKEKNKKKERRPPYPEITINVNNVNININNIQKYINQEGGKK